MFDIHNSPFEDGDFDDEAALEYRHALITAFAESPEGEDSDHKKVADRSAGRSVC